MKNKLFCLIFVILLALGIGTFVHPQDWYSANENRELSTNKKISIDGLLDTSFVSNVESVLNDQMLGRVSINAAMNKLNIAFCSMFQNVEFNGNKYMYVSDDYLFDGEYIIKTPLVYDEDLLEETMKRGYNINEMSELYPNIKTYVYFATKIEDVLGSDGYLYRDAFTGQLNSDIKTDYLKILDYDEFKEMFYKTDSHWNNKGAYQGYKDIINMISEDFSIDSPREIIDEINCRKRFVGNLGKVTGVSSSYDKINDYVLDGIGKYDYYEDGEKIDQESRKESYMQLEENCGLMYLDDYFEYYSPIKAIKEYDFHQKDKPNILIISDSYVCANQTWIASHFNKTLILDLRGIDEGEEFNFNDLVMNNDIDIILVFKSNIYMYYDGLYIPLYN